MPRVLIEEVVAANRADVFALAQDYKHRLEWDSFTTRVRFASGSFTSMVGLIGAANFINPLRMKMEHYALASPSLVGINMLQGPFFFKKLKGSWRFECVAQDRTRIHLEYQFNSPWPLVNHIIDPVLAKILKHDLRLVARDMKHALEDTDIAQRL